MKRVLYLGLAFAAGCSYLQKNKEPATAHEAAPKIVKRAASKMSSIEIQGETKYVPSGTQIEFRKTKKFTTKDSSIKIDMSSNKKCILTVNTEKEPEVEIDEGSLFTVVGYREETNELIMTDSKYHQLQLSCTENPSANKGRAPSSILIDDIQKMEPVLIVRFLPM